MTSFNSDTRNSHICYLDLILNPAPWVPVGTGRSGPQQLTVASSDVTHQVPRDDVGAAGARPWLLLSLMLSGSGGWTMSSSLGTRMGTPRSQ